MIRIFSLFVLLWLANATVLLAQKTFPVNGAANPQPSVTAFIHAVVHLDASTTYDDASLLIKEGRIIAAGPGLKIPEGARIIDLKGKHLYPSLIDLYADYGVPGPPKKKKGQGRSVQLNSSTEGAFGWNQAIRPQVSASDVFRVDPKKAGQLRKMGFGTVLTHVRDGIMRGTGTLVTLSERNENYVMLGAAVTSHYSFRKGSSQQRYPSSEMGSIALLRQTFLDAEWYTRHQPREEYNLSLAAYLNQQELPAIFEVPDYHSALRADKLGDAYGKQFILKGKGDEYKRIASILATEATYIIPLTFPKPYDIEDPFTAMWVPLEDMKHWELAPANAALLAEAGVPFVLTSDGLKSEKEFWKNLRKAHLHGLSDSLALEALTMGPARILGMEAELGSLAPGKWANFLITSKPLFDSRCQIYENWVQGKRHTIKELNRPQILGEYDLNIDAKVYDLTVKGSADKPKGELKIPGEKEALKVTVQSKGDLITLVIPFDSAAGGTLRLSGKISYNGGLWDGQAQQPDDNWVLWSAILDESLPEKPARQPKTPELGVTWMPNVAYGSPDTLKPERVLIRNATLWTNTDAGILNNTDLLIESGKIARIGTGLAVEGEYREYDAQGKHLTPGIIDEHSHIAIHRGVNEGSHAVTAEVSIGDVVNSDDVNLYRQLSGGVTAAQLLHGSANPIGGRSALIKFRWGQPADSMLIDDAAGFIKFALGENVKQSNWGIARPTRFPQTRMGVEQVYYDAFIRASEYDEAWKTYQSLKKKEKENTLPPRENLQLQYLAEILNSERFISCHSYVQSEINMLMHVADSMGFRVNTFTHILEGYKVADKMVEHGAGGSTFSDWWAYKFEVNDAIPYNAAMLNDQGVVTAINSDDAEMGRRLNQEAAKTVKYGGASEEDALKMVTLNPAKLLHLDHRMGSLAVGMDADIVIWTDHPLSIYARAEQTYIDGILFFSLDRDTALRVAMQAERQRLIEKMLAAKKAGEKTQPLQVKEPKLYHCDTLEDQHETDHSH